MPWSGSAGSETFSRTDGTRSGSQVWQDAEAAAVDIVSDDHDTHDQDVADGINSCLKKDGGNTATANIPMGSFKLTGLAAGTENGDSVRFEQLSAAGAGAWNAPSGTIAFVGNATAPSGWTKGTTHDNKALRLVTGTPSTGGSTVFTSVFTSRTIATANLPSHTHSFSATTGSNGAHTHDIDVTLQGPSVGHTDAGELASGDGTQDDTYTTSSNGAHTHSVSGTTGAAGSGTAMDFAVSYIDVVLITKD